MNTLYIATISKAVKTSAGGVPRNQFVLHFTTGERILTGPLPVSLGTAGNFAILAKSGIDTVPASVITGNIGVSPAALAYVTGFSLTADASNVFSTASQVTGKVYAANLAVPTPGTSADRLS